MSIKSILSKKLRASSSSNKTGIPVTSFSTPTPSKHRRVVIKNPPVINTMPKQGAKSKTGPSPTTTPLPGTQGIQKAAFSSHMKEAIERTISQGSDLFLPSSKDQNLLGFDDCVIDEDCAGDTELNRSHWNSPSPPVKGKKKTQEDVEVSFPTMVKQIMNQGFAVKKSIEMLIDLGYHCSMPEVQALFGNYSYILTNMMEANKIPVLKRALEYASHSAKSLEGFLEGYHHGKDSGLQEGDRTIIAKLGAVTDNLKVELDTVLEERNASQQSLEELAHLVSTSSKSAADFKATMEKVQVALAKIDLIQNQQVGSIPVSQVGSASSSGTASSVRTVENYKTPVNVPSTAKVKCPVNDGTFSCCYGKLVITRGRVSALVFIPPYQEAFLALMGLHRDFMRLIGACDLSKLGPYLVANKTALKDALVMYPKDPKLLTNILTTFRCDSMQWEYIGPDATGSESYFGD